jgi:glycosyltransferase involved in cell wall biosynthesis
VLINLVSRDNGVGLTTDMELLEDLLTSMGHDVMRVDWRATRMRRCHVIIFLELYNAYLRRMAQYSVGIFNLEWMEKVWVPQLGNLTQLWAKSDDALETYCKIGYDDVATYTGFLSRDLYDPSVERKDVCLHVKGNSDMKGTDAVLEAWRDYGDSLPPLTVVSRKHPVRGLSPGVTVLPFVSQAELVRLMNESRVHLCPSRTEGWGHYITEAMSAKAVVVTTDAPPMNEQVRADCGILLPATEGKLHNLAPEYSVESADVANAVWRVMDMSDDEKDIIGSRARERVLQRNRDFGHAVGVMLGELTVTEIENGYPHARKRQ